MEIATLRGLIIAMFLACFISSATGSQQDGTYLEELEPDQDADNYLVFSDDDLPDEVALLNRPSHVVKRSTANMVDIAMFEDSSAPGKTFSIYVDDTMSRLIIRVEVEGSNPVMMITRPSGIPGPHPSLNTTTGTRTHVGTIDTAVTATDYGIWKIMKMDASKWTVKVQGESPLDFSYQFLEGTMFKMPITGDPIQGKTYTTTITVPEFAKIQKIDMVMIFVMAKSTPANMLFPKDNGGGKYELASVKMLDQEFMIGIQGKDKSGHMFRRVVLIKPFTLSLLVPSYAGVKLYENAQIDITFYVVNELSTDQEIDVRIEDTKKFAQTPIFIAATLTPGQNYTGKFVIKGGQPGETTVATISARQYLGHGKFSLGPSEVRQFTVERNDTTTTSTTTTTTTTTTATTPKSSSTTSVTTPQSSTSKSSSVTTSAAVSLAAGITTVNTKKSTVSSSPVTTPNSSPQSTPSQSVSTSSVKSISTISGVSATGRVLTSSVSSKNPSVAASVSVSTSQTSTISPLYSSASAAVSSRVSTSTASKVSSLSTLSSAAVGGRMPVTSASMSGAISTTPVPATLNSGSPAATTKDISTSSSSSGKSSSSVASVKSAPIVSSGSVSNTVKPASLVATTPKTGSVSSAPNKSGTTTTTTKTDNGDGGSFNKGEVFAAAIASGMASGVFIGVAALVTMGLVLKKGMKGKNSVEPEKKKNKRTLSEHNQLAWT